MIDLPDVAAKMVKAQGYVGVTTKRLDSVKEGIVFRRIPSAVTDRYFDLSVAESYIYQVIVKRQSERKAIDECSDIADFLDGAYVGSENGSYRFIGQEVYTEPQEMDLTEGGYYAWECRIKAQIKRKGQ